MAKDFTSQAGVFMQAEAEKKTKPKQRKGKAAYEQVEEEKKNAKGTQISIAIEDTKQDSIPIGYELKPESKSKRLNLLIRPSLYEGLKDKAQAAGQSVNDYLNDLIAKDISK